jgi:hypothetical protein
MSTKNPIPEDPLQVYRKTSAQYELSRREKSPKISCIVNNRTIKTQPSEHVVSRPYG